MANKGVRLALFKNGINKRQLLSSVLSKLGLLPVLRFLDARKPSLKILAYHRVVDIDRNTYLFDDHLVDASVAAFDKQMCYLSKHYELLPLSEAYTEFENTEKSNIVSITFDDGFDDLYFNVFPILKKYNIRPTMFITTGLIGTNKTLWSEQVIYALKKSKGKTFSLPGLYNGQNVLIEPTTYDKLAYDLLQLFKRVSNDHRLKLMGELFKMLKVDPNIGATESRMLTWDMVREMAEWGVEFGSHSVTHSLLSQLSDHDMRLELSESKEKIEQELGVECKTLAYPVGGDTAFNKLATIAAQQSGYEMACIYLPGVVHKGVSDKFSLKRLHVDHTVDIVLFYTILAAPATFAADFHSD